MVRSLLTMTLGLTLLTAKAQDAFVIKPAAELPELLKKGADVIFQLDEGNLEVLSPSEYTLKVHQVATLLNEEAGRHLHHKLGTDKFYKVEEVEIRMLDAKGQVVKKYSKKDFETEAAFDGFSLVTDDRVMKLYTPAPGYPCTIDVQYKLHATGYIELPNWFIDYNNASTAQFRYRVKVPASLDVRHRTLNFSVTPKVEAIGGFKQYTWETNNVLAKKLETEGFEPAQYLPQVEVAPNEFSYDGSKGSFRTWKDFGAWGYGLYEEKEPFSEQRLKEIRTLVADAGTQAEKIDRLYLYLQQNMRYVSIQLGIGGFKPFAVKFVDEKKYGDCKALTNYMRYLLQAVGIVSYPALVNAGSNKIPADPAFPTDPFNHVILCIPGAKDTTWLECTSKNNRPGSLGSFTENKRALLLTPNGGVLIGTPKSDYQFNRTLTRSEVKIDTDGGAHVLNQVQSTGDAASLYQYISQLHTDRQKELLVKNLRFKSPDELVVTATNNSQSGDLAVTGTYDKLYEFKAGNKYFFPITINRLVTDELKPFQRETEFLFSYPYQKADTTIFQLPTGFVPESLSADREMHTSYSSFIRKAVYEKETHRIIITSSLVLKQHVIPAAAYSKLVSFFRDVQAAEDESFILVKQ